MKAVIYSRVSSLTQAKEGDGINGQITACKYFCGTHKLEVDSMFSDEGVSGKLSERKGLNELMNYVISKNKKSIEINYVLVHDLDRISRDLEGRISIKRKIETDGKAMIISTKGGIEKNSTSELMQNIDIVFAEHRRKQNTERVLARQKARLQDGYRTFVSYPGYKSIKDSNRGGKILILDGEHAITIAQGLEKYSKNILQTKTDLQMFFEERGLLSLQKNKQLSYDFITRILSKKRLLFYAGYLDIPNRGIEMVQGKHPAIITMDTVDKILTKHNPKKHSQRSQNQHILDDMILRNYLLCESCNKPLSGGPSRGKLGKIYNYYRCFNTECSEYGKSLNAEIVHNSFEKHLKKYALDKKFVEIIFTVMQEVYDDEENNNSAEKVIITQLQQVSKKINNIQERLLNTTDTTLVGQYESLLKELLIEKKSIEEQLSHYTLKKSSREQTRQELLDIVEGFGDLYNAWLQGDYERRRLLIRVVMEGIIYFNKKKGISTPNLCFIYAAFNDSNKSNFELVEVMGFEPMSESHIPQRLPS